MWKPGTTDSWATSRMVVSRRYIILPLSLPASCLGIISHLGRQTASQASACQTGHSISAFLLYATECTSFNLIIRPHPQPAMPDLKPITCAPRFISIPNAVSRGTGGSWAAANLPPRAGHGNTARTVAAHLANAACGHCVPSAVLVALPACGDPLRGSASAVPDLTLTPRGPRRRGRERLRQKHVAQAAGQQRTGTACP